MSPFSALLATVLALQTGPSPARPDSISRQSLADSVAALNPDEAIARARELTGDADYDRSISVLKQALAWANLPAPRRREIYLLLIKNYVYVGNDFKFRPQGQEQSNLNYQEAKRLITQCLRTRDLRHTKPEPVTEYPPEMVAFFKEIRAQIFGSFRLLDVTPIHAFATLDGDTLRNLPGEPKKGDIDITVGQHLLVVGAEGFKPTTERITVTPGVFLEKSYRLERRHGPWWYAARWVGAAGVVSGVAAIAASGGGGSSLEPLPGAPDPPNR